MATEYNVKICTNCMLMAVNDDDSGDSANREAFNAGMGDWREDFASDVRLTVETEAATYGTKRCGVCGIPWAGTRYPAVITSA